MQVCVGDAEAAQRWVTTEAAETMVATGNPPVSGAQCSATMSSLETGALCPAVPGAV